MSDAIKSILAVWDQEFGLFLLVVTVVIFGVLALAELICRKIEKADRRKIEKAQQRIRECDQKIGEYERKIREIEKSAGPEGGF